MANTIGSD